VSLDPFSEYYAELLDGTYDCVDRIVVNAYFQLAQRGGGFRVWWRRLFGGDDKLDTTHLMRMAGRFSRRVHGWAKKKGITLIHCKRGERKHELAETYLPQDPKRQSIFLVLVSRAPAPVWEVERFGKGGLDVKRKSPMPYVNHYSFHIFDREWGHVTVRMSGHPPFGAQILLNGHEYVASQARAKGIDFTKEGNCFTEVSDYAALAEIADTLRQPGAMGRLSQVCRRWVFSCLRLALDVSQIRKSGFEYSFSVHQVEYSRNLIFNKGREMEQVFSGVIDRTRGLLDVRTVKTLFGYKHRPHWKWGKNKKKPRFEMVLERPEYGLSIFKIHFRKQSLKIYTKGERVLRIEAVSHNTKDLGCGRVLEKFPLIVSRLEKMVERFLEVLRCVDTTWLSDELLEQFPRPTLFGKSRVAGIDLNQPRIQAVVNSVVALSAIDGGFRVSELASKVGEILGGAYTVRQASYDLKKLRAKGLAVRRSRSRRYETPGWAVRSMAALMALRDKVIKPLLAGAGKRKRGRRPRNQAPVDACYEALQKEMQNLFECLRIAA